MPFYRQTILLRHGSLLSAISFFIDKVAKLINPDSDIGDHISPIIWTQLLFVAIWQKGFQAYELITQQTRLYVVNFY